MSSTLPPTATGGDFNEVFTEVTHSAVTAAKRAQVRLFHLNVNSAQFSYTQLWKYLRRNIGSYVFSRAQVQRYADAGDTTMIALEALEQLRENINTQHALGEMMLYLFLENVLHAPKVLSKFEIDTSSGTARSSADAIHLMPFEPASKSPNYVLGSAYVETNLHDTINGAFRRIHEIEQNRPRECHLTEQRLLGMEFPAEQSSQLKELLLPSPGRPQNANVSYALFLGYTLGLEASKHADNYLDALPEKMRDDLIQHAQQILNLIDQYGLGAHQFYVYTLPLNDAAIDREDIVDAVITGRQI